MASPNRAAAHDTLQGRTKPDASIIRNALSMEAEHRGADPQKEKKKKEDRALDEALEESFPASDPPAPSQPTGPGPAGDPRTKP